MIYFFKTNSADIIAVGTTCQLTKSDNEKLIWLFDNASLADKKVKGIFIGPRKELITPWSTNAVEITQNIGISGIFRIEEFISVKDKPTFDPMLQSLYKELNDKIFTINKKPDPIFFIDDIAKYNQSEGLALSDDEIEYLEQVAKKIGRKLTDSEVFGFSQVNSEHCRHKIFNGKFILDGKEMKSTLFQMIKDTTKTNPNHVISAYKDNCALFEGPTVEQFAPATQDKPDFFKVTNYESTLSLKAETHNFPTTVEPFNGGSTGSGGEIRDRIAGGKGAVPVAGIAVYMTSYPRLDELRQWEKKTEARKWLYQSPEDILIKASNGASDFGNKSGHPIICGSALTFEHFENQKKYGFDKVIMLAGGIGIGKKKDCEKDTPEKGDKIILLGGDNYRIGMGGGAVSSVDTGEYDSSIELNAVQRANPEMQKRVYNTIRALFESDNNPIVSIHDHGAGGHLNCLAELVETAGGKIDVSKLPVGDPSLSDKEIIGNESQERMGLILKKKHINTLRTIAEREKAPFYIIGEITGDNRFTFENTATGDKPIDLPLDSLFGNIPKIVIKDNHVAEQFAKIQYNGKKITDYIEKVLQLEEVACKDWLTNKVDRSASGKIAKQQCAGPLQLPLNNLGAIALDFRGKHGFAVSVGHAPAAGLIDETAGSTLAIAEALTNIIWAPLSDGLRSVSLSANWMWPCKNAGEDVRLYNAVKAASNFSIALGINIPTGKDSLSMTQKYNDDVVISPGTVIISAAAEVSDIKQIVEPVLVNDTDTSLLLIDLSRDKYKLGGSCLGQILNTLGNEAPTVKDPIYFKEAFDVIQSLIKQGKILAGHDISAGGLVTTLLEMCFANTKGGIAVNLTAIDEKDTVKALFSQNPGIVIQVKDEAKVAEILLENGISYHSIGRPTNDRFLHIKNKSHSFSVDINEMREKWFHSSYLLDRRQSGENSALERYLNFSGHDIKYNLGLFNGSFKSLGINPDRRKKSGIRAAIIREKGVSGDREMAYALHLAGFDVKDVHMTDLISGRETLTDVNMIVFVGGSSNSDVFGLAKGWTGAFKYNPKAAAALDNFFSRKDTLSLGVCNGFELMVELGVLYPDHKDKPKLTYNNSNKFESGFLNVRIPENNSVMLGSLSGMELGVWIAHKEGRFSVPYPENRYFIPLKYSRHTYPANPNGSDFDIAGLCSKDGRHLVMMPHIERSFFPWQCGYYPPDKRNDDVTPWIMAFVNAYDWIKSK